jgi:hypothetical protein
VGAVSAALGALVSWYTAKKQAQREEKSVVLEERELYITNIMKLIEVLQKQIDDLAKENDRLEAKLRK